MLIAIKNKQNCFVCLYLTNVEQHQLKMKTNLKEAIQYGEMVDKKMEVTVNFKVFLGFLKLSDFNATFLGVWIEGGRHIHVGDI